ncbi:MAG TPA: response regulator [Phycisphaerales bacterium]|nr:response regulator [Phycisphaerales bacterium]
MPSKGKNNAGHEGAGPSRSRARSRRRVIAQPQPKAPQATARALVVSETDATARLVGPALGELDVPMETECSIEAARSRLHASDRPAIDLLIIDGSLDGAGEFVHELSLSAPATACVMVSANATLDDAVEAMRCGAIDLIDASAGDQNTRPALQAAIERARVARHREERTERLRRVCRKLNSARHEVTSQVSDMCNDLVDAYRELSGEIDKLAICGEFNGIIRQELDIESLLRVVLEFILAKSGPTNAAIFLPATSDEFSLGAYVNCDIAKDCVDTLLDHLADVLAPRFENRPGVHRYNSRRDVHHLLGPDAHWLPAHTMVAFPCHHDDECLAVVTLFRDDHEPFDVETVQMLETISSLFSKQLARIIHVHNRHLPKHQWGALGDGVDEYYDDGPDDIDLAA